MASSSKAFNLGDLKLYSTSPKKCLEERPTTQSVFFCEEPINLTAISRHTAIGISGLSLIFSRRRDPSLKNAQKIAKALGMGLGEFLKGLGLT
jgi:hypothetical protein